MYVCRFFLCYRCAIRKDAWKSNWPATGKKTTTKVFLYTWLKFSMVPLWYSSLRTTECPVSASLQKNYLSSNLNIPFWERNPKRRLLDHGGISDLELKEHVQWPNVAKHLPLPKRRISWLESLLVDPWRWAQTWGSRCTLLGGWGRSSSWWFGNIVARWPIVCSRWPLKEMKENRTVSI